MYLMTPINYFLQRHSQRLKSPRLSVRNLVDLLQITSQREFFLSDPVTLYGVASCLVDREQSAHGRTISTVRAQFKGNFFQKLAKETMV